MKTETAKVLHEVCGLPMLGHVLSACSQAGVRRMVVVVGHGKDAVTEAFADRDEITWVEQIEQKGTGHAALVCEPALAGFNGRTIVMAGDMPLVRPETLTAMLDENASTGHGVTLATSVFDEPRGYGRIVRNADGRLAGIAEEADCTDAQKAIREVNISYYCFDNRRMFDALHHITPDNAKGEYYITDAVKILLDQGLGAGALPAVKPEDAMGVNDRADLAEVNRVMQRRIQDGWLARGVTILDRSTTWIESECEIGPDTVIYPFSYVSRGARIGARCGIGPFAIVAEHENVAAGSAIGPTAPVGASYR